MKESKKDWYVSDLGMSEYKKIHRMQVDLIEARHNNTFDKDIVFLLEHPQVFTLGRRGGLQNLKVSESDLNDKGIEIVSVERGGDITFHGPGQIVCYLLIDLNANNLDIPGFVYLLEEVMIRTARDVDVDANRDSRNHGVWINGEKLGSIGIAIRHGFTFHGFSLNVNNDLTPYQWIHPCGLKSVAMTSLSVRKKTKIDIAGVSSKIINNLSGVFHARMIPVERKRLDRWL